MSIQEQMDMLIDRLEKAENENEQLKADVKELEIELNRRVIK